MEVVKEGILYLCCPKCKGKDDNCGFCSGRKLIPMLAFLKEDSYKKYLFKSQVEFIKYLSSFMSGWYKKNPDKSPLDYEFLEYYHNLNSEEQDEYLKEIKKNKLRS